MNRLKGRRFVPGRYERVYTHLWKFFDGALKANSGGHCREEYFDTFTIGQLQQAESELTELASYGIDVRTLGALADTGYTLFGQTMQNDPDKPDDEQHRLIAFDMLDTLY